MENNPSNAPPRRPPPERVNFFGQILLVGVVGAFLATLFTAASPAGLIPAGWIDRFNLALTPAVPVVTGQSSPFAPTQRPLPIIGIVAGHYGSEAGTTCNDGFTELDINLPIASLVQQYLTEAGYQVDLLEEFDPRLNGYLALALVSIHADSCTYINELATGFKVANTMASAYPQEADRLSACLRSRYAQATGLPYHAGSVTADMTSYHAFTEIHTLTTAAIIEVGFLNLDRQYLVDNTEAAARGIADGILCYIHLEETSPTEAP